MIDDYVKDGGPGVVFTIILCAFRLTETLINNFAI